MTLNMSVHVLQNPFKVIQIEGNLNDSNSWRKPFAKLNGNIFNGYWMIALKSFSYEIKNVSPRKVLKVHCNVVTGYEHEQNVAQAPKNFNPSIAQIHLNTDKLGIQFKYFEYPTFFVINNVTDLMEIHFSFFPKDIPIVNPLSKDIEFEAVFHYYCQSN